MIYLRKYGGVGTSCSNCSSRETVTPGYHMLDIVRGGEQFLKEPGIDVLLIQIRDFDD